MANVTANGTQLWLSGRYDRSVYVLSTAGGAPDRQDRRGQGATRALRLAPAGPLTPRARRPRPCTASGRCWRSRRRSIGRIGGKIPIRGCAAISCVRSAGGPARLTLAGVVVSLVQIGRVVDARGRL